MHTYNRLSKNVNSDLLQYPEGYLEAQAANQEHSSSEEETAKTKGGRKRKKPGEPIPLHLHV